MADTTTVRQAIPPEGTPTGTGLPHPPIVGPPGGPSMPRPSFQIVPLRALPFVGVILAGLVVSIAGNWLWALDFYHVVGGGLWTGIDLFVGFVIGPILGRLSIPARIEFSTRFMPKMLVIMPTLVTMTLGAGFQLARHLGTLNSAYPHHVWVVVSFVVVGVMTVVALGILEPANVAVLFELKKPQPDGEVIGRLMKRFVYSAGITGAMQVATLIIMTRLAT
ncbi:MAG: hypothetical protein ACYDHU_06255 [Acidimicrobiales bacterium]